MAKKDLVEMLKELKGAERKDSNNIKRDALVARVDQIKELCFVLNIPVFMSLCIEKENGEVDYFNDCILADTQNSKKAKRIADLILAVNKADIDIPDAIKRNINALNLYLDSIALNDFEQVEKPFREEKLEEFYGIAEGAYEASIPKELFSKSDDFFDDDEW